MPKGSSLSESVTAMLEVPRGVVLQQGLPGSALEGRRGSQAALHQMGQKVEIEEFCIKWTEEVEP